MRIFIFFINLVLCFGLANGIPSGWTQSASDWPENGWHRVTFPAFQGEVFPATPGFLISQSVRVFLLDATQAIQGESVLVLDPAPMARDATALFYLNPGLTIDSIRTLRGENLPFQRAGAAVSIDAFPSLPDEPYLSLSVLYRGRLESHGLFEPPWLSSGVLQGDLWLLPPEALWHPYWPGQTFTGRLRVVTPEGLTVAASVEEEKIVEKNGIRTTDFSWRIPLSQLAAVASRWRPAQIQSGPLTIEMLFPPERTPERGLVSNQLLMKLHFFGRAFYPLPWSRITLAGAPDADWPLEGHGLLVLPGQYQEVHILGHPLLDRMLAKQWLGELVFFAPDRQEEEKAWVEFAARFYLNDIFEVKAQEYWTAEGQWLTRLSQPRVGLFFRLVWLLRAIEFWTGDPAFWELNQEFFQRHLYQRITIEDYLEVAREILYESPSGPELYDWAQPWLVRDDIPSVTYSYRVSDATPARLELEIVQQTTPPWPLQLEVSIAPRDATPPTEPVVESVFIDGATGSWNISIPFRDAEATIDPGWRLLMKRQVENEPAAEPGGLRMD